MDEGVTCAVCGEHDAQWPSTSIEEYQVCRQCIKDLFDHSLTSNANFPPRWGKKALDPWDFRHLQIFDTRWLAAYDKRAAEWSCPDMQRVYCERQACEKFLGRLQDRHSTCKWCDVCMAYTCLMCRKRYLVKESVGPSAIVDHECIPMKEQDNQDRAFAGLKRGRDWQECPSSQCRRRVQLSEACNHMICPGCLTEFCYICGNRAVKASRHWLPGGCPMWGQPSGGRAVYDHEANVLEIEAGPDDEDYQLQYGLMLQVEDRDPHQRQPGRDFAAGMRELRDAMRRLRHNTARLHIPRVLPNGMERENRTDLPLRHPPRLQVGKAPAIPAGANAANLPERPMRHVEFQQRLPPQEAREPAQYPRGRNFNTNATHDRPQEQKRLSLQGEAGRARDRVRSPQRLRRPEDRGEHERRDWPRPDVEQARPRAGLSMLPALQLDELGRRVHISHGTKAQPPGQGRQP